MNNVDERVVELKLYNQQFESGIKSSVDSLNNLKNGLKLDESAQSLSNLDHVGRTFSLTSISDSVDALANKFSTLGIIGITALQNITNSVINTGKQIVESLTIAPINDGLDIYETKINAIQTILTNTATQGTSLNDVNKALAELNEYSNQTIYHFSDMTRNIGTFTAAGVKLQTSVDSIKGIANLAAGSGSSALQASTAMYQLSQAIASGTVKLMDWNSVINAGMGGTLFQNALEKTAVQLGHGRDMAKSFRDSLQDGWLTTDVLTKTLQKFANDPSLLKAATEVKTFSQLMDVLKETVASGWAVTWENIIGNKDEAASFFTAINNGFSDVTTESANARNSVLAFWKANGGRDALLQSIGNALIGISTILKPIEDGFREIFPPETGAQLVAFTKGLASLTASFKIGDSTAANLKSTFGGLFAVLDIGRQALLTIANAIGSVIKYLLPAADGVISFTGNIGDFLIALDNAIKKSDAFNFVFESIGNTIKPVADGIKRVISTIVSAINSLGVANLSGLDTFFNNVSVKFKPFTTLGNFIHTVFLDIVGIIQKILPSFYVVASAIGDAFDRMWTGIIDALRGGDASSISGVINGGLLTVILLNVKKFIGSLTSIGDTAGGLVGRITGTLDGVKDSLAAYQSTLKASILLKIAASIAILAVSLVAIASIDSQKLTTSLAAMATMMGELFGAMAMFGKITGGPGIIAMTKITITMNGLAVAILILSHAMQVLSKIDQNGIARGLTAIATLSGILVLSAKALDGSSAKLISSSAGFILFGAAINVLVTAVQRLGSLNVESLQKGLIGVGVLATELSLFLRATDFSGMGILRSAGLLILSASLNVLSSAVKKFGEINTNALIKGLAGVGAVLTELGLFVNLTGDAQRVTSTAIGLTVLGASMLIFANAIGKMGSMSLEQIGKGLLTMAGALASITLALTFLPKGIVLQATGLVIIASSLLILSRALSSMSGTSWEQIAKGLVTLAGSLTIIAAAMYFMTTALPGAAALLIITPALTGLAYVLKMLGGMGLPDIGIALLALAGVFGVIGGASVLLAPLVPAILSLSLAIAALGGACVLVGAGVALFATGLAALAVSGAAGSVALSAAIMVIVGLVPAIAKALAQGLIDIIKVIGDGAPVIAKALISVVQAILTALVNITPDVVTAVMKLLTTILQTLLEYMPNIVDIGSKLIVSFLTGISAHIQDITDAAIDLVLKFIAGVITKLPDIVDVAFKVIVSFVNGLAEAIRNNTETMYTAIKNLMSAISQSAKDVFIDAIKDFAGIGVQVIQGLINGMESMVEAVASSASNLGSSVIDAAKKALGIHSPSKIFADIGNNLIKGLTGGIEDNSKQATKASENMSNDVVKASSNVVKKANEASKAAFDAAVKWIDDRKYYNELSLQQELEAWQKLQAKYVDGTDEREKADKEAYRVKQEIIAAGKAATEKAYKAEYDTAVKWIDDRKYYGQLSLNEELVAWQKMQAKYIEGTTEREKADKEAFRVKQELNQADEDYAQQTLTIMTNANEKRKGLEDDYYNKTKEINDKLKTDIQSLTDAYNSAVKSRTDTIYNAYSLFNDVESQAAVTSQQLLTNLGNQVNQLDIWQQQLSNLKGKGVDSGLLAEIQIMGPQSLAQVKALNSMSADQLARYVSLWKEKYAEANTEALSELDGMKKDTVSKISDLTAEANKKLDDYRKQWAAQMTQLTSDSELQLANLRDKWMQKIGSISNDTEKDFSDMTTNIQTTLEKPDWSGLGTNIVAGIRAGVQSQAMALADTVAQTALNSLNAAKAALGINSPSKEFAKVGMYSIQGLIVGLKNFAGSATSTASNIGTSITSALKDTILSALNVNNDLSPTITPVLDMTNVNDGLASAFSRSQTLNVNGASSNVSAISANMGLGQNGSVQDSLLKKTQDMIMSALRDTGGTDINGPISIAINASDLKQISDVIDLFAKLPQVARARG